MQKLLETCCKLQGCLEVWIRILYLMCFIAKIEKAKIVQRNKYNSHDLNTAYTCGRYQQALLQHRFLITSKELITICTYIKSSKHRNYFSGVEVLETVEGLKCCKE
ncbi:hypothetical protein T08_4741 [Trichinella sp. T8]|nr:hypothetical protein T08_4741 [Trichinella sp. T8]